MNTQEKADVFFSEGKTIFDVDVQKNQDFERIPDVRQNLNLALNVDPWHMNASVYMDKVNAYIEEQAGNYKERFDALFARKELSNKNKYDLLCLLKKRLDLEGSTGELTLLKVRCMIMKSGVARERKNRLAEITASIAAEENTRQIGKLAAEAVPLFKELKNIGSYGRKEKKQKTLIEDRLLYMVQNDLTNAADKIKKHQYGAANNLLNGAERSIAAVYPDKIDRFETIKYDFYVQWAGALIAVEAYGQALEMTEKALAINYSDEARKYKQEASMKAASVPIKTASAKKAQSSAAGRNYDAEIKSICADISQLVKNDDLVGAWETLAFVKPKVREKNSKNLLAEKEKEIIAALKPVYDAAVQSYNEEDYEVAADYFKIIITVQPSYAQAQGYFDRCKTKIRALSGIE